MNDKILKTVCRAIEEINETLSPEQRLELSPHCILYGEGSILDSMGLVNLIVAVEQQLQDELTRRIIE